VSSAFVFKDGNELIEASIRFLTAAEGGRQNPIISLPGLFRPHAVAEGADPRHGVMFVSGPEILTLGEVLIVQMLLFWHPKDPYDDFIPGTRIALWEGPHLVATATTTRR
jgi:hypothetical protein